MPDAARGRDQDPEVDGHPKSAEGAEDADDAEQAPHPLLEIQRLDTETEQMQYRLHTLPQRLELSRIQAELDDLQRRIDLVTLQRHDVLTRQKRLEDEAATIQAKADTDDKRLYSGEITAIRDLQALQDEIVGLRSRQGKLEDHTIEAMLDADQLAAHTEEMRVRRTACQERAIVLEAELASTEADISEQLAALSLARAEVSVRVDGGPLAQYERLRQSFGPSTAVSFDPSSGCGCPHQMPTVEVSRIKRCEQGAVLDCAECGRLVLR